MREKGYQPTQARPEPLTIPPMPPVEKPKDNFSDNVKLVCEAANLVRSECPWMSSTEIFYVLQLGTKL